MRPLRVSYLLSVAVSVLAVGASGPPAPLVARQITAATAAGDLFSGSDATGGIGDWYLSNGLVEAVVDDVGFQSDRYFATHELVPIQNGLALTGGTLIDLGLVGQHDDQLTGVYQLVDLDPSKPVFNAPASFVLGQPGLPSILANVDATAGIASLTAYGFSALGPNGSRLGVETRYSLRSGENFLRMRSTVTNTGANPLPFSRLGDTVVVGVGQLIPYIASPGRGFVIAPGAVPVLYQSLSGRLAPGDGIADTDGMLPAGEVSYGFMAESGLLNESGDARVLSVAKPPAISMLQAGATYTYERRIYVAGRNDAAAITDQTLPEVSRRYGIPMGRVRGRLQSPQGHPFRASIQVFEVDLVPSTPAADTLLSAATGDHSPLPITQLATDSGRSGSFDAVVPVGQNELRIAVEGRDAIGPLPFDVQADQTTDVGTILLSDTGTLSVQVTDADSGAPIPARVTLKGVDVPDPTLGDPIDLVIGGKPNRIGRKYTSPFANVLFTASGQGDLALRPGRYRVIASHGTEYDMAYRDVQIGAGLSSSVALAVHRAVDSGGWLAADFHIHAAPSADSSVPPEERVRDYAAEGIQVMVSADHDFVFDYAPLIARMGLGAVVTSMAGTEITTARPFGIYRAGVGHMNAWPLAAKPQARKNGSPEDEQSEPAVIYDRVRALGARIVQMNHPFSVGQGYLWAIDFDAGLPLTSPPNDALLRTSALGTGTRNVDFDAIEIYNGLNQGQNDGAREAWFNLLDQGIVATATANSDSHDVSAIGPGLSPGLPRTYVAAAPGGVARFDPATFNANLEAGKAFGTSGPLLAAEAQWNGSTAGPGETLGASGCCLSIHAHVQAPCWIPVGEVRFYANGVLVASDPAPSSCAPGNRFDGALAVSPSVDTWYVVLVDEIVPRPPPSSFNQQLAQIVYPVVRFQAFSNPIFVDVDGNGRFDPPGVPAP